MDPAAPIANEAQTEASTIALQIPRYSYYALGVLTLVNFLNYIDRQILPAVAPLMAALVALCGQKGGATPRDFVARVYGGGSSTTATKRATTSRGKIKLADFASTGFPAKPIVFDVTEGTIDGFVAKKGWDACTGLGVPVGTRVLKGVYGR